MPLDKTPPEVVCLTEKEQNLIKKLREIGWGRVMIFIEGSQPVRIEEGVKGSKL